MWGDHHTWRIILCIIIILGIWTIVIFDHGHGILYSDATQWITAIIIPEKSFTKIISDSTPTDQAPLVAPQPITHPRTSAFYRRTICTYMHIIRVCTCLPSLSVLISWLPPNIYIYKCVLPLDRIIRYRSPSPLTSLLSPAGALAAYVELFRRSSLNLFALHIYIILCTLIYMIYIMYISI